LGWLDWGWLDLEADCELDDEDASGVGEFWVDEFAGAEASGFDELCAEALKQQPRSTTRNQTRISPILVL